MPPQGIKTARLFIYFPFAFGKRRCLMFWLHNTEQDMNWYDILKGDTREQLEANWREQAKVKGTSKEVDYEPVCREGLR
jgi:hypothetical protein